MTESKMKFYTITDDYINFLRKVDRTLLNNTYESRQRPYVGIIMTFGVHQYFAPLSSYKAKYDRVRNHTIHKVYGKDETEKLAVIKLNCMFPIIQTEIKEMDFSKEESKYKDLLEKEYSYVISTQEEIERKARKLYKDVTKGNPFYSKISSDFSLLEQEYVKFNKWFSLEGQV